MEGYTDQNDSLNVGLHEMAHAIHFEDRIANEEYGFLNPDALAKLEYLFEREKTQIEDGTQTYLRSYAATNHYEFFAVSIEHFFEDPAGMKRNIPDLYDTLRILINQDPLQLVNP
jgi:hypothetical protein